MSATEPEIKVNPNQTMIDGLRQMADFLESRPDFMEIGNQRLFVLLWDKSQLKDAARQLGSFAKVFDESWFNLRKSFSESLTLDVSIAREQVCKKVVTWDCSDDESLLKLVDEAKEAR